MALCGELGSRRLACMFLLAAGLAASARPGLAQVLGEWTELPGHDGRKHAAATYEPVGKRMILFGGAKDPEVFNDLRALTLGDSPAWSTLPAQGSVPGPRILASLVYDSIGDRLLLYGGRNTSGQAQHTVHAYSVNGAQTWSQVATTGQGPFSSADDRAVFDPVRNRLVVMGGDGLVFALDLSVNPAVWSFIVQGGTPPPLFFGFSAVYDAARDRVVTFGGRDQSDCPPGYDGCSCSVNCPAHCFPICNFRATATFDLSGPDQNIWRLRSPGGTIPDWRAYHTAVYDPVEQRMLMMAGTNYGHPIFFGGTHAFTGGGHGTWATLATAGTAPDARAYHAAVYDPLADRVVLFGGANAATPEGLPDAWALALDHGPPAAVGNLAALGGCRKIFLSWTAPGDDGTTGTATSYEVYMASFPITPGNYGSAQVVGTWAAGGPAGTLEEHEVEVGKCSGVRYFALRTVDHLGNWSALSNVPSAQTACPRPPRDCEDIYAQRPVATAGGGAVDLRVLQNPAGRRLELAWELPPASEGEPLALGIHDLAGRRVLALAAGPAVPGTHRTTFELRDPDGAPLPGGIYFAVLRTGTASVVRKFIVLE